MRPLSKLSLLLLGLALTLPLAGCHMSFHMGSKPVTASEDVAKSFDTIKAPRIVVELFDGGIDVTAGGDEKVDVKVTKRGAGDTQEEAKADLANVEVDLTKEGDTIRIVARQKMPQIGNRGASASLQAPPGAVLELKTSNGQITTVRMTGGVTATSSNGRLEIKDGKGKLDLTTSNGMIEIDAADALVNARSSNGTVKFTGSLAAGAHALTTSNGGIEITLPADARFRVDAETSNGQVKCAFPADRTDGGSKKKLQATIGASPAATLNLRTSNGQIHIEKGSTRAERE